jgi:hypothetical protein
MGTLAVLESLSTKDLEQTLVEFGQIALFYVSFDTFQVRNLRAIINCTRFRVGWGID